jgi:hypothetical protein
MLMLSLGITSQACEMSIISWTPLTQLEMNLAANAEATSAGTHPGYEPSALEGLTLSLDVLNEKRIKVVINGGSLRPKALAEKVYALVCT